LGLLSKASLIALLPVVGMAVVVAVCRCQISSAAQRFRLAIVSLLLTFGLAALLSAWYFVRNLTLFGDPLGWSFLLKINALREGPLTPGVLAWLASGVFRSFWLGWIGIEFDGWIYWLIGVVCLVGLGGFIAWLVRRWRDLDGATRWTLILLGLHLVVTLASLLRWTAIVQGTDQGRLIYPILPTVMLVLSAGWAWWGKTRAEHWLLGGLSAGMLILAIVTPIRYIAPVHAPAPVASTSELAAAEPLNVDWNGIRLLGFHLESDTVRAGDKLMLHLYWQGLAPIDRDFMALIKLVNSEGEFLMYTDGSPTAGRDTTDRWMPGVPLASQHLLPVPDYGTPGSYRLTISLHPFGEQTWLPAVGQDGSALGDEVSLPVTIHVTAP
jgi:hypothetical protein